MSKKTITKNSPFVIFLLFAAAIFAACHSVSSSRPANRNAAAKDVSGDYENPRVVGAFESEEINESSGFAASACQPDVFWTHNDSGDAALLYAVDRTGARLGVWKVEGAQNRDWEDLAAFKSAGGECFLYVGDIGDNQRKRDETAIYVVEEPNVAAADKTSSRKNPRAARLSETIRVEYPNAARFDAETLLVHPQTGDVYVLTKSLRDPAGVYKLPQNYRADGTNTLEKIADLTVPSIPYGFLTGGDIAPDGKRVIISDYLSAYEIVLPATAKNFDDIWREKPLTVELGAREQGEAICYAPDGKAIYATSEKANSPIIEVKRK